LIRNTYENLYEYILNYFKICTLPHCKTAAHCRTAAQLHTAAHHAARTATLCHAHCRTLPRALPHTPPHYRTHLCALPHTAALAHTAALPHTAALSNIRTLLRALPNYFKLFNLFRIKRNLYEYVLNLLENMHTAGL
jgi:hypothetical protein